jgi:NAD(P)-dependent dehydrogenase (short-subunit alcohol dehydrogenase family)
VLTSLLTGESRNSELIQTSRAAPARIPANRYEYIERKNRHRDWGGKRPRPRNDVLFANAGIATVARIGEVTEEAFDRTVAANVKGTFFTVQTLLPVLRDGASGSRL